MTLALSGGTATSVAVASAPSHGTATTSGTSISYTPTAGYVGSDSFTYTATNGSGTSSPATVTITVTAPTLTLAPASVSGGTAGTAYSQAFATSGGTAPYSYAIVAGALPGGVTLSGSGTLAGTPTQSGSFTFSVNALDSSTGSGPYSATRSYTLSIAAPTLTLAPATLVNAMVGSAYSQALTVSGGTAPYSYAVTAGALPAGLTLSSTGTLSGTPSAPGTSNFTITATDIQNFTAVRAYTVTVADRAPVAGAVSMTVAANSPANAVTLNLSGGTATSIAIGTPPNHGTLTGSGTSISYTPSLNYSGSDSFTYTATNASGTSAPATVTITVAAPTLTLSPTTLPGGTAGTAYSQALATTGGTAPYSYAVTAGALPAGLTLSSNGTLSGTPTAAGTFSLTVTATDAQNFTAARAYTLTVAVQAPVAGAVSKTVAANSSANAVTLALSGGAG
ncbi:beta strand repeat-containing protein, partial [Sphingomonas sanguinis]|uniref:beta strand repeat-containing protein n=1 Tax=Sphingomonas sanguinis TaxID=33051 RepID=UPI0019D3D822